MTQPTDAYPIPRLRWPLTWVADLVHWVSKWILWALFRILLKCESVGWRNVPRKGGAILVCNHTSFLDPPLAGSHAPRLLSYLIRQSLMDVSWALRWWLTMCRCIPMARGSRAAVVALREAIHRIQRGEIVLVFPEGTRSPDGSLQQAKSGVGILLYETQAPVIPAYAERTSMAWPRDAKWVRRYKTLVRIHYGQPVHIDVARPPGRPMGEHLQHLADQVMEEIRKLEQQALAKHA